MCSNCYHSRGRDKKAWKCPHTDKIHYALGFCQNCYQANYTKIKSKTSEDDNSVSLVEIENSSIIISNSPKNIC